MNVNSSVDPCTDIQSDPIIVSNVGPRVDPDTEPSVDSSETPNFDPDHHQETTSTPYCNYIPSLNTRYNLSSSLVCEIFADLTPGIQF